MQFVNLGQQCKITSIPSHVHSKCTTHTGNNPSSSRYIFRKQHTAFLRHAAQSLFCFQQNAICCIILPFPVKIIFTFYIKQALKFKYPPSRIKVQKRLNLMLYHRTFTNQLPNVDFNWCCAACSAILYIFPSTNPAQMLSSPVSVEFIAVSVTEMLSLGREENSVHSKVRI